MTYQILGLPVNTLAAGEKDSVLTRDNLKTPIETQLSQKQQTFSQSFAPFFKSSLNFQHFDKKDGPHRFLISKITDSENVVR